jgi:hypothetical protein
MEEHFIIISKGRIPKQNLHYQPREQRKIGYPMKRWAKNIRPQQATSSNT